MYQANCSVIDRPERRALLKLLRKQGFSGRELIAEAGIFQESYEQESRKQDWVAELTYEQRIEASDRKEIKQMTGQTIVVPARLPVRIYDSANLVYIQQDFEPSLTNLGMHICGTIGFGTRGEKGYVPRIARAAGLVS